jgi:hypothetical protein
MKAFSVKMVIALIRGLVRWTKDVGDHSQNESTFLKEEQRKSRFFVWTVEISQNPKMVLSFGLNSSDK